MFLTQCSRAERSVLPSQSLDDVIVSLKQYAASASKTMSSIGAASSTNANCHEETHISFHNVGLGLQVSMSHNNETESHELGLDKLCVCNEHGIVL